MPLFIFIPPYSFILTNLLNFSGTSPIPVEKKSLRKSREHYTGVLEKFLRMGLVKSITVKNNNMKIMTFVRNLLLIKEDF